MTQQLRVADKFEQMTQQLGGGAFLRAQIDLRGTTKQMSTTTKKMSTTTQIRCAASTRDAARAAVAEVDWLRNCPRLRRLARRCLPERPTGPATDAPHPADALELVWEAMGPAIPEPAPLRGSCIRSTVVFKPAVGASTSISTDRTKKLHRRNSAPAHIVVPKGKGGRKKSVAQTMYKLSLHPGAAGGGSEKRGAEQAVAVGTANASRSNRDMAAAAAAAPEDATGHSITETKPVRPRQKSSPVELPSGDDPGPLVVARPPDTRALRTRAMTLDTWSQFRTVIEKEVDRHRSRNPPPRAAVDFAGCFAAITITTKPEVKVVSLPDTPTSWHFARSAGLDASSSPRKCALESPRKGSAPSVRRYSGGKSSAIDPAEADSDWDHALRHRPPLATRAADWRPAAPPAGAAAAAAAKRRSLGGRSANEVAGPSVM